MKKSLYFIFLILFMHPVFSLQEDVLLQNENENSEIIEKKEESIFDERNEETSVLETETKIRDMALIHRLDFVFGVTPTILLNSYSKKSDGIFVSAVSPIVVPIYIGLTMPNHTAISFHPTLKFFWNYNLVYEGKVLPAEIENRTMQTFSFLLTLPIMFKINFFDKNSLSFSTGVSALIRFSSLAKGINANELGGTGTAKSDVSYANKWYWENLRFLYVYAGVDWMFYKGRVKYGPELSIYIPFSLITEKSYQNMMFSLGMKVQL